MRDEADAIIRTSGATGAWLWLAADILHMTSQN